MPIKTPKVKPAASAAPARDEDFASVLSELGLADDYGSDCVAAPQEEAPVTINKITFQHTTASRRLWRTLDRAKPSAAIGPSATGKTLAATAYAAVRKMSIYVMQCSEETDKGDLRGTMCLRDGATLFMYSPLIKSLQDTNPNGVLFLADELNSMRTGGQIAIHSITQSDFNARIVVPETGETFVPNPKWRFCATWNPGYGGTRPISEALLSRLSITEFDTMPPDLEHRILSDRYPTLLALVPDIVTVAGMVRSARAQGSIDFDMCLRTEFDLIEEWHAQGGKRTELVTSVRAVVLPKIGDPCVFKEQREGLLKSVEQLAMRANG